MRVFRLSTPQIAYLTLRHIGCCDFYNIKWDKKNTTLYLI
jgi:hypothetical protein